jgi:phospholipid-binding lipoprotein MlaA
VRHTLRVIALTLTLALLAGCARGPGVYAFPEEREVTSGPLTAKWHQLAQNQSDPSEDDEFDDLFPDDSLSMEEDYDPLETFNRFIFAINEAIDFIALRPAAEVYRFLMPEVFQDSVRNFTRNLKAPVIWANNLFQGKDEMAATMAGRFLVNSTLGIGGLFDVADSWFDLKYHSNDFGRTLGFYGAGPGPYLVLPLLGPSSVRDGIGKGVDFLISPWGYVLKAADVNSSTRFKIALSTQAAGGIDLRARNIENLDELKRDSVDFYARIRSLYLQLRRSQIKGESTGDIGG